MGRWRLNLDATAIKHYPTTSFHNNETSNIDDNRSGISHKFACWMVLPRLLDRQCTRPHHAGSACGYQYHDD